MAACPQNHPRIEACGALDELNATLGFARPRATFDFLRAHLLDQQRLVDVMGEVGVLVEICALHQPGIRSGHAGF